MPYSSCEFLDHVKPILVFGRDGQVGRALQVCLKDSKTPAVFLGRSDCDLSNQLSIRDVLNHYQPQVIINAAAYTSVDKAESADHQELAFAVNATAPGVMAQYVAGVVHGVLVHYSTDYVFADTKTTSYHEIDEVGPVNQLCVYGQSKLASELAIMEAFDSTYAPDVNGPDQQENVSRYFILRTSWVYGDGDNFIRTMLRLARERDQLRVVADQVGVPTSAHWLAEIGMQMAGSRVESGIYHAVPDGKTSWHGLAVFAIETAANYSVDIQIKSENIHPMPAVEYPAPAKRPYNSQLNNEKLKKSLANMDIKGQYPHWGDQVKQYVIESVEQTLKS